MEEQEIIANCKKGQAEAFGELFESYNKKIYNFLYFRTHHKPTAEDLTSLVFTKAFEKIHQFDGTRSKFYTWLYQIAKHTLVDYFRSLKHTENIEDIWDLSSGSNVERDTDTALMLTKAKEKIKLLPVAQREIVIMRLWDGLSHKEIAEILNITEANSKVSLGRALEKLRLEMGIIGLTGFLITKAVI